MTRRVAYPNKKFFNRPDQAYARSDSWTTRYYHRKTGDSVIVNLVGLNVTDDDAIKGKGESPYMWNVRLHGTKEAYTRAQSMSRLGWHFCGTPNGCLHTETYYEEDIEKWSPVDEKTSLLMSKKSDKRMTELYLKLRNATEGSSSAYFVVVLRRPKDREEVCRAFCPVKDITKDEAGEWKRFRFIRTLPGDYMYEVTIVDDIDKNGVAQGASVEVAMSGYDNHKVAKHELPNLDKALREVPYEYSRGIGAPIHKETTTDWQTFPVWLQNDYFVANNRRWVAIGAIDSEGKKRIFKAPYVEVNMDTGESKDLIGDTAQVYEELIPASKINQNATQVRMAQAGDHLYFVDGFSNLQKVNLGTWAITDAAPTTLDLFDFVPHIYYYAGNVIFHNNQVYVAKEDFQSEDEFDANDWDEGDMSSYTAWPGASLIYFFNNRLYLSGFHRETVGVPPEGPQSEPNLIILSYIDSVGPQYDMFKRSTEFFHVPDRSNAQSATSPISGFADISDKLVVFLQDTLGFITIPNGIEFGSAAQSTPEGSGYGALKQEHITQGRNNIYFYNPTEGVMRLGGSVSTVVSMPVDAILKSITDQSKIDMSLHKSAVRLFYHNEEDDSYNNKCLYDYIQYAQHTSYWFRDNNSPVAYAGSDNGYDRQMCVGSEYPCLMEAERGFRDFDCCIEYEYHTRYLSTPSRISDMILRRVHVTTQQNFNSSMYLGIDWDHQNNPAVWRKYVERLEVDDTNPDGVYNPETIGDKVLETGTRNINIRLLTDNTNSVQVRIKEYCYDGQAEIVRVALEYGERMPL